MSDRSHLILKEIAARAQRRAGVAETVQAIRGELFDRQLAVLDDPAKEIAVLCSRRAGKTSMWPRVAVICALEKPRGLIRIWASSLMRAEQMIWTELQLVCARHKIDCEFNQTKFIAKFANGSEIRLLGADKQKEAEKKRGDKTSMEIVLEAQLFGAYLKTIVEDIAGPCLADLNGTFYLEGTPGPVCTGYWYSASGENGTSSRWVSGGREVQGQLEGAGWSCHRWSLLDNPFPAGKEHWRQWLTERKKKRNWADDNPTYRREYLGQWVNDNSTLFYGGFDPLRNLFDVKKFEPWGPGWQHVLGWDLGFRDDMALVVWGYHPKHDKLYEAFSWKRPAVNDASVVMDQIVALEKRGFNLTSMVADTGGGGKMYVEEVANRFKRAFTPAKKTEKYEHVRLYNDDLRTGHIMIQQGSPLALEIAELPKDPDWPDPEKPEKPPTEDPRFANHALDASLYSFRAAMHWLHRDEAPIIKTGSPEWHSNREKANIRRLEQRKTPNDSSWLDRFDNNGGSFLGEDD